MSIAYEPYRTYGVLGDFWVHAYWCSECGHRLYKEDRMINHCPYCGFSYTKETTEENNNGK